ncbi:carbohydrate esterase family 3 protein [Podospora aff. communis PSN243]|uniref:Carbohydrate esterase family 3 protein n=1 Tax=Podospora aff. communis PSN243 TaxID=3040156 RepID=A0AAV9GZU3_9PEZI|nr:carbohydrate esterase family 3 protein [Podospora aff. communis PSN243]
MAMKQHLSLLVLAASRLAAGRVHAASLVRRISDNTTTNSPSLLPPSFNNLASVEYDNDDSSEFDPTDLSHITKLAAIGDSYSAGIGAGERLGNPFQVLEDQSDFMCSRFTQAYPHLIHTDGRLGPDPSKWTFEFRSCSGAVLNDVLTKQIPALSANQQCIFQWALFRWDQEIIGTLASLTKDFACAKKINFAAYSRGCEGQLQRTGDIIASDDFAKRLDKVISAAKTKLAPDGMLYYTGYAKFFSETYTDECNKVSWTTFLFSVGKLWDFERKEAKLTGLLRRALNKLVDEMNAQLKAAVQRAGSQVKFVNYDKYVGEYGGRYCEAGVDESRADSGQRPGLMFYELSSLDFMGGSPWKRSEGEAHVDTFQGEINMMAQLTLLLDPEARLAVPEAANSLNSVNLTAVNELPQRPHVKVGIMNVLPDGYGRVFHPQVLLHRLIANLIIYEMASRNQASHGYDEIPEVSKAEYCPIVPNAVETPKSGDTGDGGGSGGSGDGRGGGHRESVEEYAYLTYQDVAPPGVAVKPGTKLRIHMIGDRISALNEDRDGNEATGEVLASLRGYLSADDVEFTGLGRPWPQTTIQKWTDLGINTGVFETGALMCSGIKWVSIPTGQVRTSTCVCCELFSQDCATGQFISDKRPNIVLVHIGTNQLTHWHQGDAKDSRPISPQEAVQRVSGLLDLIEKDFPGAVILLAMIIPTSCLGRAMDPTQRKVPALLVVDFSTFPVEYMDPQDVKCVHPRPEGYTLMGRLWYDFIHQIPKRWIQPLEWNQSASYDIHVKFNALAGVSENGQPTSQLPSQLALSTSPAMYFDVGLSARSRGALLPSRRIPHKWKTRADDQRCCSGWEIWDKGGDKELCVETKG